MRTPTIPTPPPRPALVRRALAVVAAAAAVATASLTLAPPSSAQDDPPPDPTEAEVLAEPPAPAAPAPVPTAASGPSLTFAQVGVAEPVWVVGTGGTRTLAVPVPAGMDLQRLRATVSVPTATTGGRLEVRVDEAVVGGVELGPSPAGRRVPLDVPLHGALPERGVVEVEVVASLTGSGDDLCGPLLEQPSVQLVEGSVTYGGTPTAPATIGEFLPPVLTRLAIVVPEVFSAQQAEAVLRLASDVALQYRNQQVAISVVHEPPPADPSWAFHRTVELTEGESRLSVLDSPAGPVLQIRGDGATLSASVDVLTGQLARLPVAPTAMVQRAQPLDQELVRGRRTVASLGYGNLKATDLGRFDIGIPFSQADLGGPTQSIIADLRGTTTPIPDGGVGSISVLLDDVVLVTESLDGSGAFDLSVPLPDSQLQRDNDLVLQVSYTPPGGLCLPGAQPITVQLSPDSVLQGQSGSGLPPGFHRFPQGFLPAFTVALATLDRSSLEVATDLVVSLQGASGRLLRPQVHSWATAVSESSPTLFVGQENADFDATLKPPLELIPGQPVQATTDVAQLQIGSKVAALQAFAVGSRDVLLATWQGDEALLDRLTTEVVEDEGGWRALDGDVLIRGQEGDPASLSVRALPAGTPSGTTGSSELLTPAVKKGALAIVAVGALVAVVAWWVWHRRRRPAVQRNELVTATERTTGAPA